MKVSIIIPFKEETGYLHECIKNCLDLDYDDFELILLPDKKINIKGKRIRVIPTGSIGPAQKRDIGSNRAKGKILAFIDDDAYPAKDWLMKVVRNFKDDIACVGGPAVTPERDNLLQKASGIVLSSRMGGGTETYRYISGKRKYVDDFPSVNLSVRKDVFLELGGFDTNYWPGEDTKFCLDLVNKKYKIIYDPKAIVFHHRRELFGPHLKQITNYALHRGYFVRKFPKTSFRLGYFIPSILVVFVVFGLAACVFIDLFVWLYTGVLSVYFMGCVLTGINTRNIKLFVLVLFGIIATHISYGVYFIRGLFKVGLYK